VGLSFLPVEFGDRVGLFREEGIELELNTMQPAVALAAIASDQVDYVLTAAEVMRATLAGLASIKLVGGITNSVNWFLYGTGGVRTMSDLRGKAIAVGGPKGEIELGARAVLAASGLHLERDGITFRTGTLTPDRLAHMQQGTLDAAVIAAPSHFRADEMGFHRLSDMGEVLEMPPASWATSEKKIQSQPEEIKRVLRATIRAVDYIHAHPDEAAAFIQEKFKLSPEQARASLELDLRRFARRAELPETGLQNWLNALAEVGEIPSANVSLDRLQDLSLLREVQREMGLR
jgi:NitT/TauT family transport system substrate-binding protein